MKVKLVNEKFKSMISDWSKRFYFVVGGYGSSKSYNVALKLILKCLAEKRKVLIVREVYATLKDSCYSLIIEILEDLEIEGYYVATVSPLRIKFINGSEIIFRGCDKPEKLKSLNGVSICWLEEPTEIKYTAFKELLGRLRMSNISLHFLMSLNPVSKSSWVYKHFIERKKIDEIELYDKKIIIDEDTFFHHSTVDDNFFVTLEYKKGLEELKAYDPDLYRIARQGRFGTLGVKVFHNVVVLKRKEFFEMFDNVRDNILNNGLDFGFVTSFNALTRNKVDHNQKDLYIYEEYYKKGMTDDKTVEEFREKGYDKIPIIADNAEQKTITYFNQCGFNMTPCRKGGGSVVEGLKKLKRFKHIYILDECVNTVREFTDLSYKIDKDGTVLEDKFNIDPHLVDGSRYSLRDYEVSDIKGGFRVIDC